MIQEIHSKIEQNPTMHPGTNVCGFSYFEKYTDIQKAMQESSIGKGTTFELAADCRLERELFVEHPPDPSAIGAADGHYK